MVKPPTTMRGETVYVDDTSPPMKLRNHPGEWVALMPDRDDDDEREWIEWAFNTTTGQIVQSYP